MYDVIHLLGTGLSPSETVPPHHVKRTFFVEKLQMNCCIFLTHLTGECRQGRIDGTVAQQHGGEEALQTPDWKLALLMQCHSCGSLWLKACFSRKA